MAEKRFVKGLFKDTAQIDQPAGSWRYAKNSIINDKKGSISNEGGTDIAGNLGLDPVTGSFKDKVIGKIEADDDRIVLFVLDVVSTITPRSEIGIYTVSDGYTILYNPSPTNFPDQDLNFQESHPIEGTFKVDSKGDLIVYWTDDLNPPRAFNVSRQQRDSTTTSQLYDITNLSSINLLNLFPYSGAVPHVDVDDQTTHQGSVIEGGGLLTGVYYLSLAYVDDDFVATNFLTVSNPIPIVDEFDSTVPTNKKDGSKSGSQTTKAIKWDISNLNLDYKYLRPVVIRKKGDATEAFKLNDIVISATISSVVFSGIEGVSPASVDDIIIDTISYDTAKTMQQLDGVLYLGNTTGGQDLGYQKYANNIKLRARVESINPFDQFYASVDNLETGWGSIKVNDFSGAVQTVDPTKSYRYIPNIFKYKGYMRDEVYAFYIAFIMNDGSMSYAYHIPGRESLGKERESVDTLDATNYGGLWQTDIYNVSPKYGKRFHWIDSTVSSIHGFAYDALTYMNMNYWENATEYYPNTDNFEVWDNTNGGQQLSGTAGSIQGLNVRHHHFPSNMNENMRSILDSKQCRTGPSSGSSTAIQAWNGTLIMIDGRWAGSTDGYHTWYDCCSNWTTNRFNMGIQSPLTNCPPSVSNATVNDPDMEAALWSTSSNKFTADQEMTVVVKWFVVHRQSSYQDPDDPVHTRLRSNIGGVISDECLDQDNPDIEWVPGTHGHGNTDCGCGNTGEHWIGYNHSDANCPGGTTISLNAGDQIWLESQKETSADSSMGQAGFDYYCNASIPNGYNYSYISFTIESANTIMDPEDLHDAKISHHVRRLGFDLEDVKIPPDIADKVQGFRIYYANRKHSDRTVLGQGPMLPAMYRRTKLGQCSESNNNTLAAQTLGTLQNAPEEFYNMDPYPMEYWTYPTMDHYLETGSDSAPTTTSVGPIISGDDAWGLDTFKFHDFYLLRTHNSLAPATHITMQYAVKNLAWNGPGLDQDKKMVTFLTDPNNGDPLTVKEVWGWDAAQNSYPQKMKSAIFIGADYLSVNKRTMPRLLGQKSKTYLLGDTVFSGDALGFGGKLFNEFGESAIAFKLMDNHAINSYAMRSYPHSTTIGYFADNYPAGSPELEFGFYGWPHAGLPTLTNTLNNSGNWFGNGGHGYRSQIMISNLKAFKTDVYKSIDSQELVWTGFEVIGDDLNGYTFDENGDMEGTGETVLTHPDGIWGGDTFICRYGVASSLAPSNDIDSAEPKKAIHYHIVESTDNINFRHQEDDNSLYFPNNVAKIVLRNAGAADFSHFDNMRYDDNFSALNNIRPAFPLPLRDIDQTDFPTRAHRSTKADPTSLIDNWRIFLANQYKDLPKNRGELWKLSSFNNLLYFHMEESLFAAKGKQSMQMKDGSEAFVGSGDIFAQEPDELVQTEDGFGGTRSQWAAITTRYGYFFIDSRKHKVFLMKDKLSEISNMGMESWFRENIPFAVGAYGVPASDNPIIGTGFHSIWDPKYNRIILTKREYIPTETFTSRVDGTLSPSKLTTDPLDKGEVMLLSNPFGFSNILYKDGYFYYANVISTSTCPGTFNIFQCHTFGPWIKIDFNNSKYFTKGGWTISYYPELNIWVSFHDYVPYIYFNTSKDFYSLTDKYDRPIFCTASNVANPNNPCTSVTTLTEFEGTTFGNAGIWKHNSDTKGILYQENSASQFTNAQFLTTVNWNFFEFEVIHNETKAVDSLFSSFNYTLETFNSENISVLEHGFTNFFLYNTFQISGIGKDWVDLFGNAQTDSNGTTLTAANNNNLEYLINIRRIGNNWKVNNFRDMAATVTDTSAYYTATGTNVIGGTNVGTVTTSSTNTMFSISGMNEIVNASYINLQKNWNLQKKFIDKWVGIRLIYNNITNNLLNLYSTNVEARQLHR